MWVNPSHNIRYLFSPIYWPTASTLTEPCKMRAKFCYEFLRDPIFNAFANAFAKNCCSNLAFGLWSPTPRPSKTNLSCEAALHDTFDPLSTL